MLKILQKNKGYLIAVLTVIVAVPIVLGRHNTKEPEQCTLCGGLKRHAPCIVNLSTGEVGEMVIYDPHPTLVGEIAEEQPGGTFAFLPCVGQRAVQDTSVETCTVQLPESHKRMNPKYFCRSCRELLHGVRGYALVDLYDLDQIRVFPVVDGARYEVRDYSISVESNEQKLMIEVQGNFMEESDTRLNEKSPKQ